MEGNVTVSESVDEEPYTIKCICNFNEDDGNTIYCETCDTWQHIECFYPGRVADASRADFDHSCADCKPRSLDQRHAIDRQQNHQSKSSNNDSSGDKKSKRPPTKSHKKKTKPSELQVNGFHDRNGSPQEHQLKKSKGHRSFHRGSAQGSSAGFDGHYHSDHYGPLDDRPPPLLRRINVNSPTSLSPARDALGDFDDHYYSDDIGIVDTPPLRPVRVTLEPSPTPPTHIESPKKKIEWSQSVREYVQRCFDPINLIPNVPRSQMENKLKETLSAVFESNMLDAIDWVNLPLPQQMVHRERMDRGLHDSWKERQERREMRKKKRAQQSVAMLVSANGFPNAGQDPPWKTRKSRELGDDTSTPPQPANSLPSDHDIDEALVLQDEASLKEDVPFTDSGFASAPYRENTSYLKLLEQQRVSGKAEVVDKKKDVDVEYNETLYSTGSSIAQPQAQRYIIDICSDIVSKLGKQFDSQSWSYISKALPGLIKTLAINIGYCSSAQANRVIMCFIYKRHKEIIAQLEATMCPLEDDNKPDSWEDYVQGMSIDDKMKMWSAKAEEDHPIAKHEELFKGVKDDEEENIQSIDLFMYQQIVLNGPAYNTFLLSVTRELCLHTNQPPTMDRNISKTILDKLPTGTLSKRRAPSACEVQFDLHLRDEEEGDFFYDLCTKIMKMGNELVLTGSSETAQLLTIREYVSQTWLANGLVLFDVILNAVYAADRTYSRNFPDRTHLEAQICGSGFFVKATGPAFFVAECGELLAWLRTALITSTEFAGSYSPLITSYSVSTMPSLPGGIKYKGHCVLGVEFIQPTSSRQRLYWIDLVNPYTLIQGFPISRRPDGYPGLELSFDHLLAYSVADDAVVENEQIVLPGGYVTMQLIKNTDNLFLWHPSHPSEESCSCCIAKHSQIKLGLIDLDLLRLGRHILSGCTEPRNLSSQCPDDKDPADKSRSHESQLVISKDESLSSLSASEKDFPFSRLSITAEQSCQVFENSHFDSDSEDPTPNILEKDERQSSEDCQSIATTRSPELSLDSDIFSFSDSSNQENFLDIDEPAYPVLQIVLSLLLDNFRGLTENQLSPSESAGQYVAHSSGSRSTSGTTSGTSNSRRKRNREEGDDEADKDGFVRPPPKKHAKTEKVMQRSLACPYLKFDPIKHRNCCTKKLSRIRDVKQHLYRKHTPERYCQCCLETNFQDEETLKIHVDLRTCQANGLETLDGISTEKTQKLGRKSDRNLHEQDQWYAIWEILFPGCPRPDSAYLDTSLSMELCLFREYCNTHGPSIIREQLYSVPGFSGQESTDEQRQVYLDRVIAQGISRVFEEYQNSTQPSRVPGNETLASSGPRGNNPHPTRFQTSTRSNADSGVVLEYQMSPEVTPPHRSIEAQPADLERDLSPLIEIASQNTSSSPEVLSSERPSQTYEQNTAALDTSGNLSSENILESSEILTFGLAQDLGSEIFDFLPQTGREHNNGFLTEDDERWENLFGH